MLGLWGMPFQGQTHLICFSFGGVESERGKHSRTVRGLLEGIDLLVLPMNSREQESCMEQTLGRSPARLGRPVSCQNSHAWGEPSLGVELPLQNLLIWSVSMEPG